MYDSDISVVSSSLNVSKDKIESKGVKSVKSRVTNVKEYMKKDICLNEFKNLLVQYMFEDNNLKEYKLTIEDISEIEKIKKDKYSTRDWNFGSSPKYNILKERRFDKCGKIELYIKVNNGIIENLNIHGDYFGNCDSKDISKLLIGLKIKEQEIYNAISNINIEDYFNNLTKKDFVNLIMM